MYEMWNYGKYNGLQVRTKTANLTTRGHSLLSLQRVLYAHAQGLRSQEAKQSVEFVS